MKSLKKPLILITIIATVAIVFINLPKTPIWENEEALTEMINSINNSKSDKLTKEQLDFIKEFPKHTPKIDRHVWVLINNTRNTYKKEYLALVQMYIDLNFPYHQGSNAHELANEATGLYKSKSHMMGALFYAGAADKGKSNYRKEILAEWYFLAGNGHNNVGQVEKAIELYKKSISVHKEDYRPYRELGLIYFKRAKQSTGTGNVDRLSLDLARRYIIRSLDLKRDQADLEMILIEISQLKLEMINNFNNRSKRIKRPSPINLPGVDINIPNTSAPQPGRKKGFKQR